MEAIWSREDSGDDGRVSMRTLYDERNAAIRTLMPEAQQEELDRIYADFEEKKTAYSEARRARHEENVIKTMAILTPAQQERYEEVLSKLGRKGSKGGHGWPPKPRN